jgi:predicted nucleotidyltransferase
MTRDEIERLLSEKLESGEFRGIVSAYLFGSVEENRSHRESDVDLGVLMHRGIHRTSRDRFDQRLLLSSRLPAGLGGRPLDVIILNEAPPLLARRIVTRGRRIFCSDVDRDHAFVRDVQLRAADLEPFLQRMRRIKLEAL